jgi:hypothetical protein
MTTYLNGSPPNYLGVSFTTTTDLLNLIKNTLEGEGWVTVDDQIVASDYFLIRGQTSNGHNCWVKFTMYISSGNKRGIRIQGDLDGTGTNVSSTTTYNPVYYEGATNYLYLTCDNDSGCILIIPSQADAILANHFGFLNRIDTSRSSDWMVGTLSTVLERSYIARHPRSSAVIWQDVGYDFLKSTGAVTGEGNALVHTPCTTFDRYTVGTVPYGGYYSYSSSGRNNAYNADDGALNRLNSLPVLGEYYYVFGYYASLRTSLWFLGTVKHAVVGLRSVTAGTQVVTADNKRYIAGDEQGFRIL